MTPAEQLYLASGLPESIFPQGCHVFPANLALLEQLRQALREDFAAVETVSDAELASGAARPLRLKALRGLLAAREAKLRPHWQEDRIRRNTLAQAQQRVEALARMNAPDIILKRAKEVVAELTSPAALPALNLELLVPDACGAASVVDADAPRYVEADVSSLVLLGALTSVDADAQSVEPAPDISWQPLWQESEATSAPGQISVRPAVYERVKRLEMAEFADSRAPGGALLLVEL